MLNYILIGLAVLIVIFLIKILSKSTVFKISRSRIIEAPADVIFEQINNSRNFNTWNPWMRADPEAEITYEGPESGVGASYSWNGKKTGMGSDTIVESIPHEKVMVRLEFIKPFASTNRAGFTLTPVGNGTEVTWSMWWQRNFLMKLMHTVFNVEKMMNSSFDSGLENLNQIIMKQTQNQEGK
ncbi:MAG: SRPBCC family protein [Emcibacteraceae bacterium]